MSNVTYDTDECIYETETDTKTQRTDLWLPKLGGGREMNWEFGVGRCKPLHLEWINNKVLLYSTKNYTPFPGIKDNGKGYFFKKECIYLYNWVILLYSRN